MPAYLLGELERRGMQAEPGSRNGHERSECGEVSESSQPIFDVVVEVYVSRAT